MKKHYQENCEVVGDRRHYEFCTYDDVQNSNESGDGSLGTQL